MVASAARHGVGGVRRGRRIFGRTLPLDALLLLDADLFVQRIPELVRGAFEFVEAAAEGPAQFRQLTGAKNDERNRQDDGGVIPRTGIMT